MSLLNEALEYYKMGFSIFPALENKTPSLKWQKYQTERAPEEQIREWWKNGNTNPIAIVTGKISGIVVVDVDDVNVGFANLANYIPANIKTPMAKTPSGGYHLYFQCPDTEVRNNAKAIPGCDFRGEGGYIIAAPSFCRYEKAKKRIEGKYTWVENCSIRDLPLEPLPISYSSFINAFLYIGGSGLNNQESAQVSTSQHKSALFEEGSRDENLFHIANSLVKGHCQITQEVLEIIARNCNPPYPEKDIPVKIKSALDRVLRKEKNIAQDFRDWIKSAPGQFRVSEYQHESAIVSKEDKHAIIVEATKLCKQGIIERVGTRRGEYRLIESDIEIVDWKNAATKEYPVDFPLGIGDLIKLYPGNIVILAGSSNTGKTTFMLEMIRLNQKKYKIRYQNSEMGASELKIRVQMFEDVCKYDDWNFENVERSDNFADAIDPDGFNVIDFMEIYDEFWKLGGWIRDIHKKLKNGIAVIAIQKKSSTKKDQWDFGRGGELTLEKPRLYMAMDRGRIKIVKAKIWRDHNRNPNGLSRNFKIVSGWKFLPADDWSSDEDKEYAKHGIINDKDFPSEKGWNH